MLFQEEQRLFEGNCCKIKLNRILFVQRNLMPKLNNAVINEIQLTICHFHCISRWLKSSLPVEQPRVGIPEIGVLPLLITIIII